MKLWVVCVIFRSKFEKLTYLFNFLIWNIYIFIHTGCNECKDGWVYMGEGEGCVDIDECLEQDVCTSQQFCINNDGSYSCLSKYKNLD